MVAVGIIWSLKVLFNPLQRSNRRMFFHSQTQLRLEVLAPLPTLQGFTETLFGSVVRLWNGTVTCYFLVLRWSFPCQLVSVFSQECSSHSSTFQGEQFPSFTFPGSEWNADWPRVPFKDHVFTWISAHKQFPLMSISWGWREWIEFPFFFFSLQPAPGSIPSPEQQQVLCSQLEKIHALFRRQLGIPLLGEGCNAGTQGLEQLQAPGFSWHSHTKCSWRSWAVLDEAQIPLDQECLELLGLGLPGCEFEDVQSASEEHKMWLRNKEFSCDCCIKPLVGSIWQLDCWNSAFFSFLSPFSCSWEKVKHSSFDFISIWERIWVLFCPKPWGKFCHFGFLIPSEQL